MLPLSSNLIRLAGGFALALAALNTTAGQTAPLSAAESDPRLLGWMQGFPPPPDKLNTQSDSNYFSSPKLRWTVCHLREFLPTEQVSPGIGAPVPLAYHLDESAIDALTFKPIVSDEEMTWKESLSANCTDGTLILHRGKIVYERYLGCLDEAGKHAAMSMAKSLTGLLVEILVAEGALDDTARVSSIIPEFGDSAFGSASVRKVMDMTTGLAYSEAYSDPNANIWRCSADASPLPKRRAMMARTGTSSTSRRCGPRALTCDALHY